MNLGQSIKLQVESWEFERWRGPTILAVWQMGADIVSITDNSDWNFLYFCPANRPPRQGMAEPMGIITTRQFLLPLATKIIRMATSSRTGFVSDPNLTQSSQGSSQDPMIILGFYPSST